MKFRLERIREIENIHLKTSRRDLAVACSAETAAREAVADSKTTSNNAATERDESVGPGKVIGRTDMFERDLLAARVAKARRILAGRIVELLGSECALDRARSEYVSRRLRVDGFERLSDRFESDRRRAREKAEEDNADDLFSAARRS